MRRIVVGTRGSKLACIQADRVIALLEESYPEAAVERVIIKTKGDLILDRPLNRIESKGLFTKELEVALYEKEIDLAVHSLKDLPVELPEGLTLGAHLPREPANDILISRDNLPLDSLPQGGVVATGSLRRRLQIARVRPDLKIVDVRGNIDTRLRKFEENGWDGLISAYAAFKRMGYEGRISQVLPYELMLPAVGQGVIAVECRDDEESRRLLEVINDETTAVRAQAERALLNGLGSGCQLPLACASEVKEGRLMLKGLYMIPDRGLYIEEELSGSPEKAARLGSELAALIKKRM